MPSGCPDMDVTVTTSKPRTAWCLQISGALMCASAVQMALGLFGIVGWLMRYISPLTIAVTVGLLGISLFPVATDAAQNQWGIAIL